MIATRRLTASCAHRSSQRASTRYEDLSRIAPFGGMGISGNGFRIGGQQPNLDAFTELP